MTRPLFCGFAGGLAVVLALGAGSPAVAQKAQPKTKTKAKTDAPPLNEKVLDFAKSKLGVQIGDGECWALANEAVLAAGGKSSPGYTDTPGKGDYVWGELVLGVTAKAGKQTTEGTGTKTVLPGDIVQFRDAKFEGAKGNGTYSMTAPHHSAVVSAVSPDGKVIGILHQNWSGKRFVGEATLTLPDLKGGWVRIYRPQPR